MSERRPHWDDYLLASVMIHCNDIYQCHAVIAAVEDWQKERFKWSDIIQSPFEVAVRHNAAEERAEKAEAAVQRARDAAVSIIAAVEDWQNNEHEAAMKELREWQRRAEVAEAEGQRLRGVLEETVYSWMQKAETLEAEVVNLSKELVLAKATIQRVRGVINEGRKHRGWGYDDDYDSGWDGCANDVERALVVVPDE